MEEVRSDKKARICPKKNCTEKKFCFCKFALCCSIGLFFLIWSVLLWWWCSHIEWIYMGHFFSVCLSPSGNLIFSNNAIIAKLLGDKTLSPRSFAGNPSMVPRMNKKGSRGTVKRNAITARLLCCHDGIFSVSFFCVHFSDKFYTQKVSDLLYNRGYTTDNRCCSLLCRR